MSDPFTPPPPAPPPAAEAPPAVRRRSPRFKSCRWRRPPEDGPECCGHRDVLPMAAPPASTPKPGAPTARSTSSAARPRSASPNDYRLRNSVADSSRSARANLGSRRTRATTVSLKCRVNAILFTVASRPPSCALCTRHGASALLRYPPAAASSCHRRAAAPASHQSPAIRDVMAVILKLPMPLNHFTLDVFPRLSRVTAVATFAAACASSRSNQSLKGTVPSCRMYSSTRSGTR